MVALAEKIQAKKGGYNDSPPNLKVMTEAEFATSAFFVYDFESVENRQILLHNLPKAIRESRTEILDLRLFWMQDGTGFGMSHDYWKGKVEYFSFAICVHSYKSVPSGFRMVHDSVCTKCGHRTSVDSSD